MAGFHIPWFAARSILRLLQQQGHVRRLPQWRRNPTTGRYIPVYRVETPALDDVIRDAAGRPRSFNRRHRIPAHITGAGPGLYDEPQAYLLESLPDIRRMDQTTHPPGPVPALTIRQSKSTGRAVSLTASVRYPPRSRPHPDSRRRRDRKAAHYRRFLRMVNRTYGRADELGELFDAFDRTIGKGMGGEEFVAAYAMDQAADVLVGRANRAWRDQVLRPARAPWWFSPVVRRF